VWRSYSTKRTYIFYLHKWIIPRWKDYELAAVRTVEVEAWLRSRKPEDWVFASRQHRGRKPLWGQAILRKHVRPAAERIGIQKKIGWHTFRHTYSTLLRSVGAEFKVMKELMRHSSLRSTLNVYTQAVTPAKHEAQAAVLSLVFSS
jgi:site-specific recombinase XerD